MIQAISPESFNSLGWLDLILRRGLWKTPPVRLGLMQEKSQSSDFASSIDYLELHKFEVKPIV